MTLLRFAIIGCGRIAQRHAEQISKKGRLEAVCDVVNEKADVIAEKYGARPYHSIEALLESEKSIDVVVICTPNGLHAQHSIQSLQAGFHVLCEKPMALHVKDAADMIEVAKRNNRQLFVVKQNRYNPPVLAVKKALDENRLGKVFSLQLNCFWNRDALYYKDSWKGNKHLDGGTLYTQFSHFIDLLYWMIGDIKDVQAVLANYAHQEIIDFEDTGVVLLKFQNGAIGTLNYTVNSFSKNMEGSLTLFAEKGTIKIGGQYLNELEYQAIKDYRIDDLPTGNMANNYGTYVGSMSNHDKVYENVIDVLHNNAQMTTTAEEGLKTVEIIEKIYRIAKHL
jgi:UDP-N-acetyl-2-amino-2-deoxyglucuronate dehydrogenase